jgi:hypothetical protein
MKKALPFFFLVALISLAITSGRAQESLAANQNPRFEESRSKYMMMADSLNSWHSVTFQDTYKAIDYMADKAEARERRRAFRRELRLERARNGYGWYDDYSYYPAYGNYGHRMYTGNRYYHRYNTPFYNRSYRSDYFLSTIPLAFALGWYLR